MLKTCCYLFLFLTSLSGFTQRILPEPYNSIELLPFDGQGWYGNASQMKRLIKQKQVKTVVEVGCWVGLSTRHIASQLPKGGKLYAVDHWMGSAEHQPGQSAYSPVVDYLYKQFLSNVIHARLTDKIIPIRMNSLEAADYLRELSVVPDLIYLDASHDTASVYADLTAWYPFVEEKGIMSGDDWAWDSVRVAVERFAQEWQLKIIASGNFWYLVK